MFEPSVAVIVLNYRGETVLLHCLIALRKTLGPKDRVFIVDNGREITLMTTVHARFPEIEIITPEKNCGFAAGMNTGLRAVLAQEKFDAFWLMNNDARVLPDTLSQLKRALEERGNRALFSPTIFSGAATTPWYAGGHIDFFRMRTVHRQNLPSRQEPYETEFLTGCALFIPCEAFLALGMLDERYFLYYEDAEYSLRAHRLGMKCWVVPLARVRHSEESRHNPAKVYWLVRSGAEFFLRESRGLCWWWVRWFFLLRRLKNWIDVRHGSHPLAREIERAYTDVSL